MLPPLPVHPRAHPGDIRLRIAYTPFATPSERKIKRLILETFYRETDALAIVAEKGCRAMEVAIATLKYPPRTVNPADTLNRVPMVMTEVVERATRSLPVREPTFEEPVALWRKLEARDAWVDEEEDEDELGEEDFNRAAEVAHSQLLKPQRTLTVDEGESDCVSGRTRRKGATSNQRHNNEQPSRLNRPR